MALDQAGSGTAQSRPVPQDDTAIAMTPPSGQPPTNHADMTPSTDLTELTAIGPFNEAQAKEIIRQVEFYLSDQNLPSDRHLLGLTGGDGNGPVSLRDICSFKKMRKFKPFTAVRDVLTHSATLDIVDQGRKIMRRFPLHIKPWVEPEVDRARERLEQTLAANPHMTKAMLKPTGFEEYYADPPVTPEQYAKDRKLYDPDTVFWARIETAIRHYRSRRKMHQSTLRVFDSWMCFGGISTAQAMFTGGVDADELDGLDKAEIAARKLNYAVDTAVLHDETNWQVDFEGVARGFLSCHFTTHFAWEDPNEVANACNVLRNFCNFLLHHDVCPEYADQIRATRMVVDQAEIELPKLALVSNGLCRPRSFNVACSTVHGGHHSNLAAAKGDWVVPEWDYRVGIDLADAKVIYLAGIAAFATDEQLKGMCDTANVQDGKNEEGMKNVEATATTTARRAAARGETLGLEITSVEFASAERRDYFDALAGSIVPRMGKLHCRRWEVPNAPPKDLPKDRPRGPDAYELIVEEDTLSSCVVGMKLVATLKRLDVGVWWIDHVATTYPSFFAWLWNNRFKEGKRSR